MTTDLEIREDAIHDLFVYIWSKRHTLSEVDRIRPYLFVSLRHIILKKLKNSHQSEPIISDDVFQEKALSTEEEWIQEEFDIEMKGQLKKAFEALSERQRQAIYLRYYEEMDYDDIGKVMNINYQSIRNLISVGIKSLGLYFKK